MTRKDNRKPPKSASAQRRDSYQGIASAVPHVAHFSRPAQRLRPSFRVPQPFPATPTAAHTYT